ncbi:MAG TPA: hypothetical protein VHV49_01615 [Pseudonocardiaceae bacterium]|nr:hypothetical protein [Pseudonocardiaceae bacterium]
MSNQLQRLGSGIVTTAEAFWYVLMCIGFGAGYLAKVPVKKALAEYGLVEMTAAEKFWYVVENIAFASGYFSKVIIKKAMSEIRVPQAQHVGPTAPMGV